MSDILPLRPGHPAAPLRATVSRAIRAGDAGTAAAAMSEHVVRISDVAPLRN
jgi:hypothetical protein